MQCIKMRLLILAVVVIIPEVLMAVPRIRRQTPNGDAWWENLGAEAADDEALNADEGGELDTRIRHCDGPGSVCVPYYQCQDGNVITDGSGLIDIRLGSTCSRYLDICCKAPIDHTVTPKPVVNYKPTCGQRNFNGVDATITGFNVTQTQFAEYPWMTAILRVETIGAEDVNLYLCGGSLIEPNVILTAAHCINSYGASNLKVRAGEWDTQSSYEIYPHQDRRVDHVIIHPNFHGGSLKNDFALLILDAPFDLAPNVDTVCLPSYEEVFNVHSCSSTGWGKDKFGKEGRFQNILKQVDLQIVSHQECEKALQDTRLGQYFSLDTSFLCAGGSPGIDTCKGDGGSPLVCAKSDLDGHKTYYQVGIVAWGIGCGEKGIPGVYADVAKAVNWIIDSIGPYSIHK